MKNIYFLLAALVLVVQSCTIQKRQHLPGYHIEWNTNDSHSEVRQERTGLNAKHNTTHDDDAFSATYEETEPQRELLALSQHPAIESPNVSEEKTHTQQVGQSTKKSESIRKQRLTFPFSIHSPAKLLIGSKTPDDERRTDGLSIASMICGILSFFVPVVGLVLAILAIVFGGIGLGRTNRNPDLKGRGMAITGLILGIIGMLFVILVLTILSLSFGFAL